MGKNGIVIVKDDSSESYHDTRLLMQLYRATAFRAKHYEIVARRYFEKEYNCNITEFLDSVKQAGLNLNDDIQLIGCVDDVKYYQDKLAIIETNLKYIRDEYPDGERIYWTLYHTYVSRQKGGNAKIRADISKVLDLSSVISERTYRRWERKGMDILDYLLWGTSVYNEELTEFLKNHAQELIDSVTLY